MNNKVIEIAVKILEGMNKKYPPEKLHSYVTNGLEQNKEAFAAAYSLLFDRVITTDLADENYDTEERKSFRFLSEDEKEKITLENYNYLLHLGKLGLINNDEFEIITSHLLLFPFENITREDINWIILLTLIDIDVSMPSGSRFLLNSNDTIN